MGGGGFLMEDSPLLDDFVLAHARGEQSRVCFIATASGDSDRMLVNFYSALGPRCRATHLALFRRTVSDVGRYLLDQDVIYVGGGNTANMMAVWRTHGVDRAVADACEHGVILCGVSAGALCWFECGVTDSFGTLSGLEGLTGLLPGSFCPHFNGDDRRRPAYHRLVHEGMRPGFGADVGAAMHFVDGALAEVVTSVREAAAYRIECVDGTVRETRVPGRYLGHQQ